MRFWALLRHVRKTPVKFLDQLRHWIYGGISGSSGTITLLTLGIFLAACALRVWNLEADPPGNVTWSKVFFSDEAMYADNARSAVVFGETMLNPQWWNPLRVGPLLHLLNLLAFSIIEVSYLAMRLVPVTASVVALGLLYLILRHATDKRTALLGLLLAGVNYIFIVYSRVGLVYVPLLALNLLAAYLALSGISGRLSSFHRTLTLFLSGAVSGLVSVASLFFVVSALPLWIGIGIASLATPADAGKAKGILSFSPWRNLLSFCLGLMVVAAAGWAIQLTSVGMNNFLVDLQRSRGSGIFAMLALLDVSKSSGAIQILRTLVEFLSVNSFAAFNVILFLIAFGYMSVRFFRRVDTLDLMMSVWFVVGILALAFQPYQPTRYYLHLLAPLSILAARGFRSLLSSSSSVEEAVPGTVPGRTNRIRIYLFLFGATWLFAAVATYMTNFGARFHLLAAALLFAAVVAVFRWRGHVFADWLGRGHLRTLGVAALVIYISMQLGFFLQYTLQPRYTIQAGSQLIEAVLPVDGLVLGGSELLLATEVDYIAFPVLSGHEISRLVESRPVFYLSGESPRLLGGDKIVERFTVMGRDAHLIKIGNSREFYDDIVQSLYKTPFK